MTRYFAIEQDLDNAARLLDDARRKVASGGPLGPPLEHIRRAVRTAEQAARKLDRAWELIQENGGRRHA